MRQAMRKQPQNHSIGKWIVFFILLVGIGLFFFSGLGRYISLASLKENQEALQGYTEKHYATVVILFILTFILQTALSIPGTGILTLSSGVLFGTVLGTFYVNIGATIGATLAFLAARHLFRDMLEQKYGNKLESIQQGFANNGFSYLLTVRLMGIVPFFLVNFAAALTRVRLRTYVVTTSIGITPISFIVSNAGKSLGKINSVKDIVSMEILGACFLFGVLALAPIVYHRFRKPDGVKSY